MELTAYTDSKEISTSPLRYTLVQGEANIDKPIITIPLSYNDIDLTTLTYILKAVNSKNDRIEITLKKEITDDCIRLEWVIGEDFTTADGQLNIEVIGVSEDREEIIKFKADPIRVRSSLTGEYSKPGDIMDNQLYEMHIGVDQARGYADNAALNADNAVKSAADALACKNAAKLSEDNASSNAALAKTSAENAKASETAADKEADRATNNILNGVDTHNTSDVAHPSIQIHLDNVEKIALDAKSTITFDDYSTLITAINTTAKDKYYVGKGMNIVKVGVPDLWIAYISDTSVPYTYISDEAFETELRASGTVQVGYYKLAMMETGKVDLSDYYTKTQVDNLMPKKIDESVYNEQYNAGTLPVGDYLIRLGV